MEELSIKVDPEHVNRILAESIIKSALGKSVQDVINRKLAELGSGYNDPLKAAIEQMVVEQIRTIVTQEYAEKIREKVRAGITDEMVDKVTGAAWDAYHEKLRQIGR